MSTSVGASCAEVYLMRKRQKEKMKRMEEERGKRGETSTTAAANIHEDRKPTTVGGKSKVHPETQGSSNAGAA
ncbi:hypothetical protein V6N13_085706 [Hibiscus sabdariffa]|uniref:Uncharacterized protein n=1 Tax=Hibiscus sabdariffa TaxID=183260 RepID=A0ABR2FR28_9ROSI